MRLGHEIVKLLKLFTPEGIRKRHVEEVSQTPTQPLRPQRRRTLPDFTPTGGDTGTPPVVHP